MNTVQRALWYIEHHSQESLTLNSIASACNVSPFYLTRAFSALFGQTPVRYMRRRRLSEAARQLADGAPDILALALEHGYNSHEAFSRAFKETFALTPEQVRSQGHTDNLILTEAISMSIGTHIQLDAPRRESLKSLHLAGLVSRFHCDAKAGIPQQWQRFQPLLSALSSHSGDAAYGACFNFDDEGSFDYMTGVEVPAQASLPSGVVRTTLPEQDYAVFAYSGHIADITSVMAAIWNHGLTDHGLEPSHGPTLEKYGPDFDPNTGQGGFEVWIAVR
ncbi:AraC family transcriptional regulator [Natronospirillum operosum]|uniref:AraC family transcriptional regulator n=1 Tax=Natronospirillum operosum TaxID=2759953 RepID=A0A4Z0WET9_9GAMM|nr:AraC family transcriptional regulator [Natronospirillum operosum]TGG92836.1 AraC family transcriptional regulator [Natronospirillum operosum]